MQENIEELAKMIFERGDLRARVLAALSQEGQDQETPAPRAMSALPPPRSYRTVRVPL